MVTLNEDCSEVTFRILPGSQSRPVEMPATWEMKYMSPLLGQRIWEQLQSLLEECDDPVTVHRVWETFSIKKIEDWSKTLTMLDLAEVSLVFLRYSYYSLIYRI